jgi:signal transduction histidine kinase
VRVKVGLRASLSASMVGLALGVALLAIAVHTALAIHGTIALSAERAQALARQAAWLASQAAERRSDPLAAFRDDRALKALFDSAIAGDPTVYDLGLFDASGRAVIHSQPVLVGTVVPRRSALSALEAGNLLAQGTRLLGPPRAYEQVVELAIAGRNIAQVRVGVSTALLRVELLDSLRAGLWVTGAALLLAVLLALGVAQILSQRVRAMMAGLERLREGEFGHRLAVEGQDELALLASSINALGERLESTRSHVAARDLDPSAPLVESGQVTAWTRVVAGLAHELADPLNAASLHLGHLKRKWGDPPPEMARHLKVLDIELARLQQIVVGFRRFSMLGEMRPQWFDLAAMLEEVVERARESAPPRIEIRLDARGAPRRFWGDGVLLRQAMANLINNAEQAMPGGGRITVTAEPRGDQMTIAVGDQGIGIPEELQARVFDVYFTTKDQGSGIGLAVVRQVVQLHRGQVRLCSKPGEGTHIALELPVVVPEPEPAEVN